MLTMLTIAIVNGTNAAVAPAPMVPDQSPSAPAKAPIEQSRGVRHGVGVDLPVLLGKRAGAADITIDDNGWLYICARTNDVGDGHMAGTVYRVRTDGKQATGER